MIRRWRHEYAVVGNGAFPIDMLRYDHCWPDTQQDAATIQQSFDRPHDWEVKLVAEMPPTPERWRSFGCRVIQPIKATPL